MEKENAYSRISKLIRGLMLGLIMALVIPACVMAATYDVKVTMAYNQSSVRAVIEGMNKMRTDNRSFVEGGNAWFWNADNTAKTDFGGTGSLSALTYDYALEKVAMTRAAEIALSYGPTRPNGGNLQSAYAAAGVTYSAQCAESIAAGPTDATAVLSNIWNQADKDYNGQADRRNILSPTFNTVGIAHVICNGMHYWVAEFSQKTPDTTQGEPYNDNAAQIVTVNVADSYISGISATASPASFSLKLNQSAAVTVSNVGVKFLYNYNDAYVPVLNTPDIACANNTIATYNATNKTITGKAEGRTNLKVTLFGKSINVAGPDANAIIVHDCNNHIGDFRLDRAATCTQAGSKSKRCKVCLTQIASTVTAIPALGHKTVTDAGYAATCTTAGLTNGSHCSRCNQILVAQTKIAALGHNAVTDKAVSATCTTSGLTAGSHCSRCSKVLVAQKKVAALGHNVVTDKAVAATCTTSGLTAGSHCSRCKKVLVAQTKIAALGHLKVIDKAVAATCIKTGLTEGSHCSRCKTVLVAQNKTALRSHTRVVDKAVEPTTNKAGLTAGSHCSVCKKVLVAQKTVPATTTIRSLTEANSGFTLKWDMKKTAEGYYIYRAINGGNFTKIATITSNATTSYTDTAATNNATKYTYKIRTYKGNVIGNDSARMYNYHMARPSINSLTSTSANKITVRYTKTPNVSAYQVQWCSNSSFNGRGQQTLKGSNSLSWTINNLKADTTYYVRVRSVALIAGKTRYSAWSAVRSIKTGK